MHVQTRRGFIGTIIILTLLFLLTMVPITLRADSNLAPNPSFEKDPYVDYQTYGNGNFSHASASHTGDHSIKIVRGSGDLSDSYGRWVSKIKKIVLPDNPSKATMKIWLKGSGLSSKEVQIGFNFWDADQKHISGKFKHVTPGSGWKQYTVSTTDIPINAKYLRIEIRLKGDGSLWADDLSLTVESDDAGGGDEPPDEPDPPADGDDATYYVSTSGSDTNTGSLSKPFRTIQHAATIAKPGDVILVRGGTYVEYLNIATSGTASKRIVFQNYPGETPIIDGNYTLPPLPNAGWAKCGKKHCFHNDGLVDIKGDYITFAGFEIRESLGRGVRVYNGNGRPKHIDILNNHIHDIRGAGILLYQADHLLIEGNDVAFVGNFAPYDRGASELGWPGAISGNGANHVIYRGNIVHENWTEGIMPSAQGGASHIVVEDNVLWDNRALQIYVHRLEEARIEGNIAYCTGNSTYNRSGNYPPGIVIANELQFDGGIVTKNIDVINNLVVGCKTGIEIWNATPDYLLKNILIAHNSIINPRSKVADKEGIGLNLLSNNNSNVAVMNNLIQATGEERVVYVWGGAGMTFSHNLWSEKPPANASSSQDVIGDAGLQNEHAAIASGGVSGSSYKLTASSSANGAGKNIDVDHDFWNKSRSSSPDIGFHER